MLEANGKLTVELSPESAELIRSAVESGESSSPEEALEAAIQDWSARRHNGKISDERLRALIEEAEPSGEPEEELFAFLDQLEAKYQAMADQQRTDHAA